LVFDKNIHDIIVLKVMGIIESQTQVGIIFDY